MTFDKLEYFAEIRLIVPKLLLPKSLNGFL